MSSNPTSTSRRRLKEILKDCNENSSQGLERIQKLRSHQAALNDEIAMLKMYTAMLEARTAIMMDISVLLKAFLCGGCSL